MEETEVKATHNCATCDRRDVEQPVGRNGFLPGNFTANSVHHYLDECVAFLDTYRWIFDFQLTKFFVLQAWKSVPFEWHETLFGLNCEELGHLPYGHIQDCWPESLTEFITKSLSLSLDRTLSPAILPCTLNNELKRGMKAKKVHEVSHIAGMVQSLCEGHRCEHIVDVGSGLAYLSLVLSGQMGYTVLGLECEEARCHGAELRAHKMELLSNFKSVPVKLEGSKSSMKAFEEVVYDAFKSSMDRTDTRDRKWTRNATVACDGTVASASASAPNHCSRSTSLTRNDHGKSATNMGNMDCRNAHEGVKTYCRCSVGSDQEHRLRNERQKMTSDSCQLDRTVPYDPGVKCKNGGSDYYCACAERGLPKRHPNDGVESGTRAHSVSHDLTSTQRKSSCSVEPNPSENASNSGQEQSEEGCSCIGNSAAVPPRVPRTCLLSLHSCGDLSPVMLQLFLQVESLKTMLCLGCCYHKMTSTDAGYRHFPLSAALKGILSNRDLKQWPSVYGLRLAAQETRTRWLNQSEKDHASHMKSVAYRGVLEFACQSGYLDGRERYRVSSIKSHPDFSSYVSSLLPLLGATKGVSGEDFARQLHGHYDDQKGHFKYIEPFTSLQVVLQPVLEGLILVDRAQFLAEQGLEVNIVAVSDENISPRNLAIVARKA